MTSLSVTVGEGGGVRCGPYTDSVPSTFSPSGRGGVCVCVSEGGGGGHQSCVSAQVGCWHHCLLLVVVGRGVWPQTAL